MKRPGFLTSFFISLLLVADPVAHAKKPELGQMSVQELVAKGKALYEEIYKIVMYVEGIPLVRKRKK